ncbi:MAG: insulinase family protein, partial [Deltaproteobacteria bacterium]|nr:insulinase family protein [Deltaproteobacteria bacterium]
AAHYGADTVSLAVVGDVDATRVLAALERRLGKLERTGQGPLAIAPGPPRDAPAREVVFVPEKASVDVLMGTPGTLRRTDPAYYPALLGNFTLGGSASARLFQTVRDQLGLTYGVSTTLEAAHGPGPWVLSMTLNPSNVEPALEAARRVAEEVRAKGITPEELAAAQDTLTGRFQVGLATNAGMAAALASFESYGFPPDFIDRHPRLIRAVTSEQVREVLQRVLHPATALTVIAGSYPPPATPR